MKKRFLPILTAAVLLTLCCLGGCGTTGTDHPAASDTETGALTEALTEAAAPGLFDPLTESLLILDGRETVYSLVRPDDTTDAVIECYKQITRAVKDKGGNLTGSTDWMKAGTDPSGFCEILIGRTNRAESRTVMDAIGFDDYAITKVNNKIVIAAHTEQRLEEAVKRFVSLLNFEGEGAELKVYLSGTERTDRGGDYLMGGSNRLEDYRIVYAAGSDQAKKNAEDFAARLKKAYGAELPAVTDREAAVGKEILIGWCDRELSKKLLTDPADMSYVIAAEGDTLLIGCRDHYLTGLAVTACCEKYVNGYYSATLSFARNVMIRDSSFSFKESNEFLNGGDVRIMSFNILCELWNDKLPVEGRDSTVVAAIHYYAPDVVGLQEVSDKWYKSFDKLFGPAYVFTDKRTSKGETNFSTLAYNTEKVTLVEHGVRLFSQGNNTKLRLVTWGLFEKKDSGKRFVAMTTHWDLGSNPQYQAIHSDEMAAFCLEMEKKYGVPVVTTGDYNSGESTEPYLNFVAKTGYQDAKYKAQKINRNCKTYHNVGTVPPSGQGTAIDHIFGSSGFTFTYFNVLVDQNIVNASDHCPIYADLKFN